MDDDRCGKTHVRMHTGVGRETGVIDRCVEKIQEVTGVEKQRYRELQVCRETGMDADREEHSYRDTDVVGHSCGV